MVLSQCLSCSYSVCFEDQLNIEADHQGTRDKPEDVQGPAEGVHRERCVHQVHETSHPCQPQPSL